MANSNKSIPLKDIIFVTIQFLLFLLYLPSPLKITLQLNVTFRYVTLSFAFLGLLLIIIAIYQMNKSLSPFPTPLKTATLIQSGVYKMMRHPIYSGIILAATGFGLYDNSIWKTGIGILLWLLFYFKSNYEETLLCKRFPDYKEYRLRTNRFFPFP